MNAIEDEADAEEDERGAEGEAREDGAEAHGDERRGGQREEAQGRESGQAEGESRVPIFKRNPKDPTTEEITAHAKTHFPYRSWCPHCVRGRGRNDPHKRTPDDKKGRAWPMLAIDYGYFSNTDDGANGADVDRATPGGRVTSGDGDRVTQGDRATSSSNAEGSAMRTKRGGTCILFGTETETNMSMAMVVPGKGNSAEWIPSRIARWMDRLGSKKWTLKSDNEPAIRALGREIARSRTMPQAETLFEYPEEQESQTNSHAESSVGVLKGIIFTHIDALETKLGGKLEPGHPILPWLVEHSANLRNRHAVGLDGKTPIERERGRKISRPICEFGEKVMCMPVGRKQGPRLNRFISGVYVGCLPMDGRSLVATEDGVLVCRTVRTLPDSMRWDADLVRRIRGTPWDPKGMGSVLK